MHASKKAEARYFDIIGIKEIEKAIAEVNRFDTLFPVQKLNEHQKIILKVLTRRKKMNSGELFQEYTKLVSKPVVDRAYRKYMKKMLRLGIVKSEGIGRWRRYELII